MLLSENGQLSCHLLQYCGNVRHRHGCHPGVPPYSLGIKIMDNPRTPGPCLCATIILHSSPYAQPIHIQSTLTSWHSCCLRWSCRTSAKTAVRPSLVSTELIMSHSHFTPTQQWCQMWDIFFGNIFTMFLFPGPFLQTWYFSWPP